MVRRCMILGGVLLALAACQNGSGPFGSTSSSGYAYSTTPQQGCASGQRADVLHQNRPGGSDYSALRCHAEGY